jgi:stalled ribosome rescue protein Dom34
MRPWDRLFLKYADRIGLKSDPAFAAEQGQDMPTHFHAIVWIDHSQAKVFHIGLSGEDEITLHPHLPTRHLHHKANSIGSGHVGLDKEFFAQVMNAVADAGEILIIGPASAKTELAKYLRDKHPKTAERIVAVETADHPSDAEIVAYAKRHFKIAPARVTATGGSSNR